MLHRCCCCCCCSSLTTLHYEREISRLVWQHGLLYHEVDNLFSVPSCLQSLYLQARVALRLGIESKFKSELMSRKPPLLVHSRSCPRAGQTLRVPPATACVGWGNAIGIYHQTDRETWVALSSFLRIRGSFSTKDTCVPVTSISTCNGDTSNTHGCHFCSPPFLLLWLTDLLTDCESVAKLVYMPFNRHSKAILFCAMWRRCFLL